MNEEIIGHAIGNCFSKPLKIKWDTRISITNMIYCTWKYDGLLTFINNFL